MSSFLLSLKENIIYRILLMKLIRIGILVMMRNYVMRLPTLRKLTAVRPGKPFRKVIFPDIVSNSYRVGKSTVSFVSMDMALITNLSIVGITSICLLRRRGAVMSGVQWMM